MTTLSVALAATWPHAEGTRRLVVEVDPAGGDLAMRFGLPAAPGLVSLAAAARRIHDPSVVWNHTQPLPSGARALVAPPGGVHTRAALSTLATAPDGPLLPDVARAPGVVVLADCGRVDPGSPAEAIARRADVLLLLTGTQGDELAHVAARLGEVARWTPRPCLLLTGEGYPTADIERELRVPTIGRLPHDPPAIATLSGHRPAPLRHRRPGGLARQVAALARTLAGPAALAASPQANTPGGVPAVPVQQVRQPGGAALLSPGPVPHRPRLAPMPVPAGDPQRNGHQAHTAGKEPPA